MVGLWKAGFDESLDGEKKEACVVAGVIGDKRQWRKLYQAWARALARGKEIPHYSSKDGGREARKDPKSVFYGWTDEQIKVKRELLADAIAKNAGEILWSALEMSMFNDVISRGQALPKAWRDPFLPPFCTCLNVVAIYMEDQEKKYAASLRTPLLIFDDLSSGKHKTRVQMVYDEYRAAGTALQPDRVGRWLPPAPLYADDKKGEPGLQMADLISGEMRYSRNNKLAGGVRSSVLDILNRAHSKGVILTEKMVTQWKANVLDLLARAQLNRHQ